MFPIILQRPQNKPAPALNNLAVCLPPDIKMKRTQTVTESGLQQYLDVRDPLASRRQHYHRRRRRRRSATTSRRGVVFTIVYLANVYLGCVS